MKKLTILFTLLSFWCHSQDFKWLQGTWKEDDHKSMEVWVTKGNSWNGTGFKLSADGSKSISEEMTIVKKGEDCFFTSDVAGPQPIIEFKIIALEKNSFTAENLNHDFPKKISYKRTDESHLEAFISDGAKKIIRFYFSKVND